MLEDDAVLLNLEELVHLAGGEDEGCSDEDDDCPVVAVDGGKEEGENTTGYDKVDGVVPAGREETTRSQAPTLLWTEEGTVSPREEVYSSRAIWPLERENASLREALQAVEVRMARANEVLRSLVAVGGAAGDADGKQAGTEDRGGSLGVVSAQNPVSPVVWYRWSAGVGSPI